MRLSPAWMTERPGAEPGPEYERGEAALLERPQQRRPRMYRVVLLNDDYTPMEFVTLLLQKVFALESEVAVRVMLKVHTEGRGVCGRYSREIAETLAAQCVQLARAYEHPLQCEVEPENNDPEDI